MTLSTPVLLYCERCRRRTPHSQRGRCMELHRTKRLSYVKATDDLARWHAVKAQVFERDGNACQRCGKGQGLVLDAHHRIPRGHGCGVSDELVYGLANLITVCRADHMFVEQWRNDAMDTGWLITRFGDVDPASVPILTVRGWELLAGDGTRRSVEP